MTENGSGGPVNVGGRWLSVLAVVGQALRARARIEAVSVRTSGRFASLGKHRWPLLAAASGLLLWVLGAGLSALAPGWWPAAFGVGAAGAALLWRRGRRWRLVAAGAGTWLAVCWLTPAIGAGLWLLGAAVVGGRAAWGLRGSLDLDTNTRLARVLAEWNEKIVPAAKLEGTRVLSGRTDSVGLRLHLQLPLGMTVKDAQDRVPRLEASLDAIVGGIRPEMVRVLPDPDGASRCHLRVQLSTPLARAIEWAPPAERRSVTDPVALGPYEDGGEVVLSLLPKAGEGRNVFVAGMKGAGKSGVLNLLVGSLVSCGDVVLWGIDLKHGMELRPWARCLDRLATEPEEARALILAAQRVERARGRSLAKRGKRAWVPTPEEPELVIVIDELADLEEMTEVFKLARKGRAVGIHLILATQRPSAQALGEGGTDLRAQIDVFVGMRISRPEDADIVFGRGMGGRGWQPKLFDSPVYPSAGYFLISSPDHPTPRPARCYLVTDALVEAASRPCEQGSSPRLDELSARAVGELATVEADDAEDEPELSPRERLMSALARAPHGGATPDELMQESGMSRGGVFAELNHLVRGGRVAKVGRGRYRLASPAEATEEDDDRTT
jgi:S-DNA-T family DNA segregation ATPase FtsK/SpoIIIE